MNAKHLYESISTKSSHLVETKTKLARKVIVTFITVMFSLSVMAAKPPLEFTAQNGFGGLSQGDGSLKLLFKKPVAFHVESHGYEQSDGTFRLDQTIIFEGKEPQQRHWTLNKVSPNNYTGTLSDAKGKVKGHTEGSRFTLKYRIKGPMVMHQTLELLPDGKTIDNVGKITLFGIPIGALRETIIKKKQIEF
jgi:hypothetical protein